jgi:hypothetical protein
MLKQTGSFLTTPLYTWAGKPAANAVPTGTIIRVSDVGVAPGIVVVSDGTRWVPLGRQCMLRFGVGVSCDADTLKKTLQSVVIPGGLMGVLGGIDYETSWTLNNTAGTKTLRVELGATAFMAVVQTTVVSFADRRWIRNRGAANSQVGSISQTAGSSFSASAVALPTGAVDTTADATLTISGQKNTAGDVLTLESGAVWIMP